MRDRIEELFNSAIEGNFTGKPVSIGKLTSKGRGYLESLSGMSFKENVDFVLNPSDLKHIYNEHFGSNEKDKGQNIPLDVKDIRSLVDVISMPDKVIFFKEGEGVNRNMFYFFKEAKDGTYNLMEIYSDKKGNLTAKTFYKTRKDALQRVMDIEKSLLPTSETYFGAILSDAKIPKLFELPNIEPENNIVITSGDTDIRFRIYGGNSGYVGYSMSKRAAQAREEGRFPKGDFKKEYGLTENAFKSLLDLGYIDDGEWHHTSKFGNKTTFYKWDEDYYKTIYDENKPEIDKLSRTKEEEKEDAKKRIENIFENHPLSQMFNDLSENYWDYFKINNSQSNHNRRVRQKFRKR